MRRIYNIFLIFFLFNSILHAQYNQHPIFPGLEGDELLDALIEEYKPYYILTYDMARDTLFKNVYKEGDSLYCIYSRHAVYMDPDEDPSTTVYKNGQDDGINTEHVYPRSKGAEYGNAKSDMHSLFPCKVGVNMIRSNFPLGEIPKNKVYRWFYKNYELTTIPRRDIENYARFRPGKFQPRDASKGTVARAMMYFYTMYRQESDETDDTYFEIQRKDFCRWHDEFPVDSLEYARTQIIAHYQDEKVNPFVIDCSLAARLYCDDVAQSCSPTTSTDIADFSGYDIRIMGNPSPTESTFINVRIESPESGYWSVRVFNLYGQEISYAFLAFPTSYHRWEIPKNNLPKGVYLLQFSFRPTLSDKFLQLPIQKLILH